MTDRPAFHGDPENLLNPEHPWTPKVEEINDEVDKINTLIVNGLTDEQFQTLSAGVIQALKSDPRNRTAKFASKLALMAATMVFVALCLWAISYLIAPLTNR